MTQSFPAKFTSESPFVYFDFTSALVIGETIGTSSVACTVYSGTDASPSSVISGSSSTVDTTLVKQKVTGGVEGVIYNLLCTITTSVGQTLQQAGFLVIIPKSV